MDKTKVLVVDDEKKIRETLADFLLNQGYQVEIAEDGKTTLELFKMKHFDLILLDLMLPKINGIEVCKEIRKESEIPIIMVTAKDEEIDKLIGLELGADDYITKPFSLREVEARMKAVLRRTKGTAIKEKEIILKFRDLEIRPDTREVLIKEQLIELTPSEYAILLTLAQSPGRPFSRLQLLNSTWGESYAGYERAIDTHVSNLRKKIEEKPQEPSYIQTVYGIGYKFGVIP
ncbi:MAG: response regulator transcription factor [Peptococcales bacterium]|jgi:DNA-binding response OmpR family regulator